MKNVSLDVHLFVVLADCSSLGCEGVQHHGRVDEVFLHALKPRVKLLKPHQLSSIWGTQGKKKKKKSSENPLSVLSSNALEDA